MSRVYVVVRCPGCGRIRSYGWAWEARDSGGQVVTAAGGGACGCGPCSCREVNDSEDHSSAH